MKIIEINKHLKEKIENVYNIKGSDLFLIKNAINNIKAACIKNFEEFNFTRISGEKISKSELEATLSLLPMANEYRVVVLDNPNAEAVKLINQFKFDNSTVLITINADKLKVGEEIDCTKLDKADINRYVLNYLKNSGLSIMEQALDYLIEATGGDMSKISNELNKIAAYCHGKSVVELKDVMNLVSNSTEYVSYMLTSAIDEKNYAKYQQIINSMTKTLTAGEIFSYLGKYFRRMQYVAVDKNDEEVGQVLGLKPYAIKMSRQCIAKNGVKFYIGLYQKYIDLDYKIKSGKITPINALYELIF